MKPMIMTFLACCLLLATVSDADSIRIKGVSYSPVFIIEDFQYYHIYTPEGKKIDTVSKKRTDVQDVKIDRKDPARKQFIQRLETGWFRSQQSDRDYHTEIKETERKEIDLQAENPAIKTKAEVDDLKRRIEQKKEEETRDFYQDLLQRDQARQREQARLMTEEQKKQLQREEAKRISAEKARQVTENTLSQDEDNNAIVALAVFAIIAPLIILYAISQYMDYKKKNAGTRSSYEYNSKIYERNKQLQICIACGHNISKQAAACPNCGHPIKKTVQGMSIADFGCFIILCIIVSVIILSMGL